VLTFPASHLLSFQVASTPRTGDGQTAVVLQPGKNVLVDGIHRFSGAAIVVIGALLIAERLAT